ncbi:hypothetical protein, partial [Paenibacillus graminis]|uniref:hypothetical protein n=1 Tax=Paenibacillus graminis TaxID=189425 RepID=UPI0030C92EB0
SFSMIECANSESTGDMRQFSVRRHLSSITGKGGQWVVHPVDSNTFPYRVQATIKHNVLLSCLRLLFIMGRKGGFSCPGGEQKLLMELFRENPHHLVSAVYAPDP